MKFSKVVLALSLGLASMSLSAKVQFEASKGIDLVVVNGAEPEYQDASWLDFNSPKVVTMEDGANQLVFRISRIVWSGSEEKRKYYSSAQIIKFDAKDAKLTIKVPNFTTWDQALEYDKTTKFELVDDNGKAVRYVGDVLEKSGFQSMRDFPAEVAIYNSKDRKAAMAVAGGLTVAEAVSQQQAQIAAQASTIAPQPVTTSSLSKEMEMFRYWFDKASPEEQETFLSWGIKNLKSAEKPEVKSGSRSSDMLAYWFKEGNTEQQEDALGWAIKNIKK